MLNTVYRPKRITKNIAFRVDASDQIKLREFADEIGVKVSDLARGSINYIINNFDEVEEEFRSQFNATRNSSRNSSR